MVEWGVGAGMAGKQSWKVMLEKIKSPLVIQNQNTIYINMNKFTIYKESIHERNFH